MQLIISENTMCFKGERHHMVSARLSTICPCRGLTCAPLSVITLGHFWLPFPGPWSPDARVWVRTNKSHLSSKPDGEREQPWEWKSTEEQPHPPCRGTQGQSLTGQFSRPNFLKCCWRLQSQKLLLHTESNIFLCSCSLPTEGLYFHFNCSYKTKQRCYWC